MAEWYLPAIIAYQAIHNNLCISKSSQKIPLKKMQDYFVGKILSTDSKTPNHTFYKHLRLKKSQLTYVALKKSEDEGNIFDVKNLVKKGLQNIDLLTYSFPCQDLSQQGKQKGMSKKLGTRSSLLWEIEKALCVTPKSNLPKYLLMENVKAITFKKNRKELFKWMSKLEKFGYKNDLQILDASNFGSAQVRQRAFMISTLGSKIYLPKFKIKPKAIKSVLSKKIDDTAFLPNLEKYEISPFKKTKSNICKAKLIDYSSFNSEAYVYDPNFAGPTLTATGANARIKILWENRIRQIRANEAFRYMGFKNTDYSKLKKLNYFSENQMIFLCGNSIQIQVLRQVMKVIYKDFMKE